MNDVSEMSVEVFAAEPPCERYQTTSKNVEESVSESRNEKFANSKTDKKQGRFQRLQRM